MKRHEPFMEEALIEARKAADLGEVPIGAVVVKDGVIIGRGHNLREKSLRISAHAEILALEDAAQHLGRWQMNGATLYVTVEPCAMCAGAMVQAGVSTLVYGAEGEAWGAHRSVMDILDNPLLSHRLIVLSGVKKEACQSLMQDFFAKLR